MERNEQILQRVMKKNFFLLLSALVMVTISCKSGLEGHLNTNQPPKTGLTVKQINRSGANRLSSQLHISWWGDDPDGYVIGYEYSINDTVQNPWKFTTKTDSTFVLPIPQGNDTANVVFRIRAIDNEQLRDPVGAELVFPIKNSPPTIEYNKTEIPPDTLYDIASFGWSVNDIDGQSNLAYNEIVLNDTNGTWLQLPIDVNFVSIEVENPGQSVSKCRLYLGKSYKSSSFELDGLKLNARNMMYVRAVDNAGAVSTVDTVSWYVKRRQSDILFLNDYGGVYSGSIADFHMKMLAQAGRPTVDYWDISDGTTTSGRKVTKSSAFPFLSDPTLIKTLAKWKHIYWISNDLDRNITYAQEITKDFFENGGTMFINIPSKYLDSSDPIFNFLPLDGVTPLPQIATSFQVLNTKTIDPINGLQGPILGINKIISARYPVIAAAGSTPLYKTDFTLRTLIGYQDFTGNEVVAVKNMENNLIYFGLGLDNLNTNDNVDQLLKVLCIDELGF